MSQLIVVKMIVNIIMSLMVIGLSCNMAANGFRLGEGGDFQHKTSLDALSLILALNFHRRIKPPLLQNGC
jgi:hypothetical protein